MARRFDPVMEMYLNGWVDISTRVQQARGIVMTPGAANEQNNVSAAVCTATLNSPGGLFNPDNPMSSYYGLIDRNAPVRVSKRILTDSFARTSVDSWGSTDTSIGTAQAWTNNFSAGASAANFDVDSGVGKHAVPTGNTILMSRLVGLAGLRNYEVQVDITLTPSTPPTTDIITGIQLRGIGTSSSEYMVGDIKVTSGGTVSLRVGDNGILDESTTHGVGTGGTYRLKAQVEGQNIRAKLWDPASMTEPLGWQVEGRSDTMAATGWPGLRSISGSGVGATTVAFDNLEIRIPRFIGELSELTPEWDNSHRAKTSNLVASGIMRRLGQGRAPVKPSPRRYIPTTSPVAYWPLDDGVFSTYGAPLVGVSRLTLTAEAGSKAAFGHGELAPWLPPSLKSEGIDFIRADVSMPGFAGNSGWTVDHLRTGSTGSLSTFTARTDTVGWILGFNDEPSGNVELFTPGGGSTVLSGADTIAFDGSCHHWRLRTVQNGGGVDWTVTVDGDTTYTGTVGATTLLGVTRLEFDGEAAGNKPIALGHLAVWAGAGPTDAASASLGWSGEAAGRRIERLCEEEGIPFTYRGDLDATPAMGPQKALSAFELIREAEAVDLGTLTEQGGMTGLAYRTRQSKFNQSARAALNYTAGHVQHPIKPLHDDRATRNQVTAKRDGGGEYTATQTTGPNNINDPGTATGAVGLYDHEVTVNVLSDDQLPDVAGWWLHLGTDPQPRYPVIKVQLAARGIDDTLEAALLSVDVDDRITIDNLNQADIFDQVSQLARGYRETLSSTRHDLDFNCAPESPWHVLEFDDGVSRWDSADSSLNTGVDDNDLSLSVAYVTIRWVTSAETPSAFPLAIKIGGERITISAISGTTSPQTFTVSARSVNGVAKSHLAGAKVSLADPSYFG